MADNTVTLVGNVTRDPELRYTDRRPWRRQLRPRRQPSLPVERRVAGADLVLRRRRLGHTRRERRRSRSPRAPASIVTGRLEQRSWDDP